MEGFFRHLLEEFHLPLKNPVLIFSTILFIILLSPIILRRFRIPSIIGLILSGVLIGPNGIGLIGSKLLESDGSVKLFATIGLLYIMFMAGLELDMGQFKKYRVKSFTFGFLTFIIPLLLGFPICFYGLKLNAIASILISSMFATHTLVSYPIISRLGISKSTVVSLTVGGTILTDTAVLIILAIISSAIDGALDITFWIRIITSLLIFSFIMFFIIPRIAKWFFKKLESEKTAHYIFVLSIIFFAAFLAEVAGIEHIIGAFVAGLVLNKLIPHSSPLMSRIDFIGNALFIPFFLISVGMIVDYKVIFQGPWSLIIAGILTGFALFSKWLAAFFTQLIFKMTKAERQIIFGLSSAHAAATLAIIMVGFEKGIIDSQIVNATILLILVTCMISSFVSENAGKKMLKQLAENGELSSQTNSSNNHHVLVAMNQLQENELLIDFGAMISDNGYLNSISVVSVIPNEFGVEQKIKATRKELEEVVNHCAKNELNIGISTTIDYNFASGISRVSKELSSDVILINDNQKMTLWNRVLGDDRDQLLKVCEKTLFFCQLNHPFIHYRKINLIFPPFSDLEPSFERTCLRLFKFASELKLRIDIYARFEIFDSILNIKKANKSYVGVSHRELNELEDFFNVSQHSKEDLLISFASRHGSVSYSIGREQYLSKLEKGLEDCDQIVIYPSQETDETLFIGYEDFDSTPLSKSVDTLQKITKEVGNILKKEV